MCTLMWIAHWPTGSIPGVVEFADEKRKFFPVILSLQASVFDKQPNIASHWLQASDPLCSSSHVKLIEQCSSKGLCLSLSLAVSTCPCKQYGISNASASIICSIVSRHTHQQLKACICSCTWDIGNTRALSAFRIARRGSVPDQVHSHRVAMFHT